MTTLNKSDLQKFSEQSGLQVDGRSEFAYTDRLEHFSRLVRLNLELEIDDLKDQLAKLRQQLAAAQEEIEASSKDSLRLLESVKYLRGIAEHGEERQQREDETVEQFVLGYVKKLEDQLAKANQLRQIAQGRCDGLEEKLAKAEQRAEWQPISTAPKDCDVLVTDGGKVHLGRWVGRYFTWGYSTDPTHWMPLPKAPNGSGS